MSVVLRPQSEFPYIEDFKKIFNVTERTIFAYNDIIYADYKLTNDLIVHEITHHEQQRRYGLDEWVNSYLTDPKFRLRMEVEAYKHQLSMIKDRNEKLRVKIRSAHDLSSELYGSICTYEEAFDMLSGRSGH